jgi:hypothetical protein
MALSPATDLRQRSIAVIASPLGVLPVHRIPLDEIEGDGS